MSTIVKHAGKGSKNVMLPNRGGLAQLTAQAPSATINDYAKKTPGLGEPTPSVMQMGRGIQ